MSQVQKANLFLAYFRSLVDNECPLDVQLKNNTVISGKLRFVDNNMCMLLQPDEAQVAKLPPQYAGMTKGIYIRGSAINMAFLPKIESDLEVLGDMCQNG